VSASHHRETQRPHEIEIWATAADAQLHVYRRLLYGTETLLNSDFVEPINIGSNELVSINGLVDIVEEIGGIKLHRSYNLSAPRCQRPQFRQHAHQKSLAGSHYRLRDGLEKTYRWIYERSRVGAARW